MLNKINNKRRMSDNSDGFTIIEVLIVLAIAGLIMLIVFLAIPALQRNQRNNARNSDASRFSAAISECLANRNGSTDATSGCGNEANVKPGDTSQLETLQFNSGSPVDGGSETSAEYSFNRQCSKEGDKAEAGSNSRDFVVLYSLEGGVKRCVGSQGN